MKQAHRIGFMQNQEIIVAETLDGEGIDLFIRRNGTELLTLFGTCEQHEELITALDNSIHSIRKRPKKSKED